MLFSRTLQVLENTRNLSLQPAGQPSIPPNMEVPVIRGVVLHLNDDPLAAPPAKDLVLLTSATDRSLWLPRGRHGRRPTDRPTDRGNAKHKQK